MNIHTKIAFFARTIVTPTEIHQINHAHFSQISAFAPNTRICVTTTPLPPVAAFTICNIALIRNEVVIRGSELHESIHRRCNVLDPYVGSASTLLAAAHLSPKCQTVGIELAHSGHVNFDHIIQDFDAWSLTPLVALVRGNFRSKTVRDEARNSIRSGKHGEDYKYSAAFDVIVSDPPYGKRERINDDSTNTDNNHAPLVDLFTAIRQDLEAGTPLLNRGGRLVAYVPHMEETDKKQTFEKNMTTMTLMDGLPSDGLIRDAGLRFVTMREQILSSRLSRWLVIYDCIR